MTQPASLIAALLAAPGSVESTADAVNHGFLSVVQFVVGRNGGRIHGFTLTAKGREALDGARGRVWTAEDLDIFAAADRARDEKMDVVKA